MSRFVSITGTMLSAAGFVAAGMALREDHASAAPIAAVAPAARVARAAVAPPSPAAPAPAVAQVAPEPAGYVIRRVLDVPEPMRQGDHYWDEAGVPAGPVVITVDLSAQTVSIFRAGYEIGTAVIIYGADDKPTPLGIFPITQKDADHVSSLYDAPMPYMLRLTNDGISIHGSRVGAHLATHGCVGVPTAFAKRLFAAVKLGDRVIITNGERLNQGGAITAG